MEVSSAPVERNTRSLMTQFLRLQTEEQNSILESIKRKLNLDKKSDSTDEDKEEEKDVGAASSPSANAANELNEKAAAVPTAESPLPQPLGVADTPKSPERTNCAEVSSTTADTDPPTVIPKVSNSILLFENVVPEEKVVFSKGIRAAC